MKKIFLLFIALSFLGCHSGWEKDPFSGRSDNVKNAVPPGTNEKAVPPLKDVVFIDANEFYDFKVGEEGSVVFSYRVTHPLLKAVDLDIPDLSQLPDATFDKSTKELRWTPPEGFVVGDRFMRREVIELILYVDNQGVIEEHRQKVGTNAFRNNLEQPEIVRVEQLPTSLKEGERAIFRVSVKDVDSSILKKPTLTIVSTETEDYDGAGLVNNKSSSPTQDSSDPQLWHFQMEIELRNKEITDYQQDKYFGLRAMSSFGVPSVAWKGKFRALTQLGPPEFFLQNVTFAKGQDNHYIFSIVDPKVEGEITVESDWVSTCSGLTPPARCSCSEVRSQATCTIHWKPQSQGTQRIEVKAKNSIDRLYLQDSVSGRDFLRIRVQ